nr:suppressor APC domain-containing protein 1-like [Misgurnus anguillicaudatus]
MASYTVVFAPLRNDLNTLDALRFFLWVKKLRNIEREKDLLLMGLQALEQARYRLRSHPEDIRTTTEEHQGNFRNGEIREDCPYIPKLLLPPIHRVNWTLKNHVWGSRRLIL